VLPGRGLAPAAETGLEPVRTAVRLRVKQGPATRGDVDGPWSHDLGAEFPELVLATSSWVGPVRRVAYHVDDWHTATSRELVVEGWTVSLAESPALQANTVVVTGPDQRRMCLLVIPPHTTGDTARAVLNATAGPGEGGGVEELLASHGIDTAKAIRLGT
jgi:hypothetical protein